MISSLTHPRSLFRDPCSSPHTHIYIYLSLSCVLHRPEETIGEEGERKYSRLMTAKSSFLLGRQFQISSYSSRIIVYLDSGGTGRVSSWFHDDGVENLLTAAVNVPRPERYFDTIDSFRQMSYNSWSNKNILKEDSLEIYLSPLLFIRTDYGRKKKLRGLRIIFLFFITPQNLCEEWVER